MRNSPSKVWWIRVKWHKSIVTRNFSLRNQIPIHHGGNKENLFKTKTCQFKITIFIMDHRQAQSEKVSPRLTPGCSIERWRKFRHLPTGTDFLEDFLLNMKKESQPWSNEKRWEPAFQMKNKTQNQEIDRESCDNKRRRLNYRFFTFEQQKVWLIDNFWQTTQPSLTIPIRGNKAKLIETSHHSLSADQSNTGLAGKQSATNNVSPVWWRRRALSRYTWPRVNLPQHFCY